MFLTSPAPLCSSKVLLILLFFFPLTAPISETEQGMEKGILGPLWPWDKVRGKGQDRAEHRNRPAAWPRLPLLLWKGCCGETRHFHSLH